MKITPGTFAFPAMACAILIIVGAGSAHAQPPKCDSTIYQCGCTIGTPGTYELANELDASQGLTVKNGCIDIEGQNIKLNAAYPIVGPGNDGSCGCMHDPTGAGGPSVNCPSVKVKLASPSGVGIHVLPSAQNVTIYNSAPICGWNYAVESEGSKVYFSTGMRDGVISLNNVGVLLNNATDNDVWDVSSQDNGTGFQIAGGSGNTITGNFAAFNSQYGFWLDGSQGNTVSGNEAERNTLAGYYLGCSSKGDFHPLIPCTITTTTGNTVTSNDSHANNYGIALERESIYNQIESNTVSDSFKVDMVDGNGNCIYNTYLDNEYESKNLPCIQ